MKATKGFDKANEIGEGGFGKVFVGNFPDGRTLAIKRAGPANCSSESGHAQFRNEVLEYIDHIIIKSFQMIMSVVRNSFDFMFWSLNA